MHDQTERLVAGHLVRKGKLQVRLCNRVATRIRSLGGAGPGRYPDAVAVLRSRRFGSDRRRHRDQRHHAHRPCADAAGSGRYARCRAFRCPVFFYLLRLLQAPVKGHADLRVSPSIDA